MKIPFHKPYLPSNMNVLFEKSIKEGWLTSGPVVKTFESKLGEYLNVDNVVALNSCTAALHLFGVGIGLMLIKNTYLNLILRLLGFCCALFGFYLII